MTGSMAQDGTCTAFYNADAGCRMTTAFPLPYQMAKEASCSRFDLPGFNLPIDFVPRVPDDSVPWPIIAGEGGVLFRNALCNDDRDDGRLECAVLAALMRTALFIWPC